MQDLTLTVINQKKIKGIAGPDCGGQSSET